jgi:hypothetical protein
MRCLVILGNIVCRVFDGSIVVVVVVVVGLS